MDYTMVEALKKELDEGLKDSSKRRLLGIAGKLAIGYAAVKGVEAIAKAAGVFKGGKAFASSNIEKIVYNKSAGKSNLGAKKAAGLTGLVLFYDSNNLDTRAYQNEFQIFKRLAEKYRDSIDFYEYNVAMENGYIDRGNSYVQGQEVKKEGVTGTPSVAMYRDGKLIDIRQGGAKDGFVENNFKICDLWIRYNLTEEFADKDITYLFENSFRIHKVSK